MSLHKCSQCGFLYDDRADRCPSCGSGNDATRRLINAPEPNPRKRFPWKAILIIATILFVAVDIWLYIRLHNSEEIAAQRKEEARLARIEKIRQDSLAEAERAAFIEDSLRNVKAIREKFIQPVNILTPVTASRYDFDYDRPVTVDAMVVSNNIASDLLSRGYTHLYTRSRDIEVEGGEMVSMPIKVYGLNCRWNAAEKRPAPTAGAWSCVVVQNDECWQTFKIYFDSTESCNEFYASATSRGIRQRISDNQCTFLRAENTTAGAYVTDESMCGAEMTIERNADNSISIN